MKTTIEVLTDIANEDYYVRHMAPDASMATGNAALDIQVTVSQIEKARWLLSTGLVDTLGWYECTTPLCFWVGRWSDLGTELACPECGGKVEPA